jgi:hypothetical protein
MKVMSSIELRLYWHHVVCMIRIGVGSAYSSVELEDEAYSFTMGTVLT